jgi:hypothetical protein
MTPHGLRLGHRGARRPSPREASRASNSSIPAMVMVQTIRFLPVRLRLSVPINPPDIPVIWADAALSDIG